jgi:ADP-dependent NAD(P)H-hydrate dehydratase
MAIGLAFLAAGTVLALELQLLREDSVSRQSGQRAVGHSSFVTRHWGIKASDNRSFPSAIMEWIRFHPRNMATHDQSIPPPPARPRESHKGTFGSALLVAGSTGMSGAAVLSGLGALRSGAGLVFLAVPDAIQSIVAGSEPSYLTIGLPSDSAGRIAGDAATMLQQALTGKSAIAIGPGLGQSDELQSLVTELYATCELPVVVDADGLNLLAKSGVDLSRKSGTRILTPHPGEFARIVGRDSGEVQKQREALAVEFASRHQIVLVLKGHGTVVTDGDRVAVNQTGNSGMSTGGTGDVLTGLIVGLLAQGMPPYESARLGVHLHGLAGDLASLEHTEPGLIASDLPRFLGAAWNQVLEHGSREPVKQWQLL